MEYLQVFLVGGIICVIGQLLMDGTKLTPAHILVLFVSSGAVLSYLGIYEHIVEFGKSGATVPLLGFGHTLAKGTKEAITTDGFLGIFLGGVKATAGGITAAIVFGYIMAVIFNPKTKK